jgi:hypothetical protein
LCVETDHEIVPVDRAKTSEFSSVEESEFSVTPVVDVSILETDWVIGVVPERERQRQRERRRESERRRERETERESEGRRVREGE